MCIGVLEGAAPLRRRGQTIVASHTTAAKRGGALGGRSSMLSNNSLLAIGNSNKSKINHSNNINK